MTYETTRRKEEEDGEDDDMKNKKSDDSHWWEINYTCERNRVYSSSLSMNYVLMATDGEGQV